MTMENRQGQLVGADARAAADRANALANKITAKAQETLAGLAIEMAMRGWAPEFRKIMWDAVAKVAAGYAEHVDEKK